MNIVMSNLAASSAPWKDLYRAALFESDKAKMLNRIAEAELAITMRARELFQEDASNGAERRALDAAMVALHTLRTVAETSRNTSLPSNVEPIRAA